MDTKIEEHEKMLRALDQEKDVILLEERKNRKAGREAILINMDDVEAVDVDFLWFPYLPAGKLTLLEGDPSVGKTYLALQLAATISKGGFLPGPDGRPDQKIEHGQVLYMTAEDGLSDTLRPRLDKMGADPSMIYILDGWRKGKQTGTITLKDIDIIKQALVKVRPVLLVVDPLSAYLGEKVDMWRANEVRPILASLGTLAEEFGVTIILIRHLTKSGGKSIYRGLGTIDFYAAARSVIKVVDVPDDNKKALFHEKHSLSEPGKALAFEIGEYGFLWAGLSDLNLDDILNANSNNFEKPALDEAKIYLEVTLKDGPVSCREILDEADDLQISKRTLERAKAEMKIISIKQGGRWFWKIATQNDGGVGGVEKNPVTTGKNEDYQDRQAQNDGGVGKVEKSPINKGKNEDRQDRQEKVCRGFEENDLKKEPATIEQARLIFS